MYMPRLREWTLTLIRWSKTLSWEANRSAASQEISRILWNPKVHCRINNSPLPVPILRQRISPSARPCEWSNIFKFYGEDLLAPRPTPKLEDRPLPAARDCLCCGARERYTLKTGQKHNVSMARSTGKINKILRVESSVKENGKNLTEQTERKYKYVLVTALRHFLFHRCVLNVEWPPGEIKFSKCFDDSLKHVKPSLPQLRVSCNVSYAANTFWGLHKTNKEEQCGILSIFTENNTQ
jgi:hypothetical protein